MLRLNAVYPAHGLGKRQLLRLVVALGIGVAMSGLAALVPSFLRVNRVTSFRGVVEVGTKAEVLAAFAATADRPILFMEGRFFLLHAPGGIIAVYRKCTHLGCAVPFNSAEDRFHCPCHGSIFDKRTGVVFKDPAPKPLQLFHISEQATGTLVVEADPLRVIDRPENRWAPKYLEVFEP